MDRSRLYREEFISYLRDKKIFSSFLYFTQQPPESFNTADEIVRIRTGGKFQTLQEYSEWAKTNNGSFAPLRKVNIPGTQPSDYSNLNVSDVPVFQWKSNEILIELKIVLFKISMLIIIIIVFFYLSFISFIKYDVR